MNARIIEDNKIGADLFQAVTYYSFYIFSNLLTNIQTFALKFHIQSPIRIVHIIIEANRLSFDTVLINIEYIVDGFLLVFVFKFDVSLGNKSPYFMK